MDWTTSENI